MHSKLEQLFRRVSLGVLAMRELPMRDGVHSNLSKRLHPNVQKLLNHNLPQGLYRHQVEAIDAVLEGKHVAITTSTASGKSISYILPVVNSLYTDITKRALYISPLKALGNDQLSKYEPWKCSKVVARFDGSINKDEREEVLRQKRVLLATPDILHANLLRRNKESLYKSFFANLRYVIIDECHVYNGVFGSNAAMVFRRLRQVCRNHGSNPQFIFASATLANAESHFKNLTGLDNITIISEEQNASPQAGKTCWFVQQQALKTGWEKDFVEGLLRLNQKFVVFCNIGQQGERLIRDLWSKYPHYKSKIMMYKAGFETGDKLMIESGLRRGDLCGVVSTSALEMGIDISDLDVCVMLGIPSSQMALLQRIGRVGRRRPGSVIIVAGETAYDHYYCCHPEELFDRPVEPLTANLLNRMLLLNHYACARAEALNFEQPKLDSDIFGDNFITMDRRVRDFEYTDSILYEQVPQFEVSIRAIEDPTFKIVEDLGQRKDNPSIGSINYSQVLREGYEGALYIHKGELYRVQKIFHGEKKITVKKAYGGLTKPHKDMMIRERHVSSVMPRYQWPGIQVSYHSLGIVEKVLGYREHTGRSDHKDIFFQQPLMRYFPTSGLVLRLEGLNSLTHGAVVGLATAFNSTYPIINQSAKQDIGAFGWSKENETAAIYLYDNVAGGLGVTENAVITFRQLLEATLIQIDNCSCSRESKDTGCIHCVQGILWVRYPSENVRRDTVKMLQEILQIITKHAVEVINPKIEKPLPIVQGSGTYGRTMITNGSTVFTKSQSEGVVEESKAEKGSERIYKVRIGNETRMFLGGGLTLIHGGIERWCTHCEAEYIDMQETHCPYCGVALI